MIWNFGSLTNEAEDDYIRAKMSQLQDSVPAAATSSASVYDELAERADLAAPCSCCAVPHWHCADCATARVVPAGLEGLLRFATALSCDSVCSLQTSLFHAGQVHADSAGR